MSSTGQTSLNSQLREAPTRAAKLMGNSDRTSPIKRGVFIRRQILCDNLPDPDVGSLPPDFRSDPPFDPNKSGRQRWEEKTSAPTCMGCHSLINPVGFAMEGYDSLGRIRQLEDITDPSTGNLVNQVPINDTVSFVLDGTQTITITGGGSNGGLGQAFARSRKANECFAKQWFRSVHGRLESYAADACVIEDLLQSQSSIGGSTQSMFRALAITPEFKLKRSKP